MCFVREYAADRIGALLEAFVQQLDRASRERDEEAIHDLRVSVRRLSESLRVFRQFFPPEAVKKVRRRLRRLMDFAAAVRDSDIALKLLAEAGMADTPLTARVRSGRNEAERALHQEIRRWQRRDYPARWPERLDLASQ